MMSRIVSRANNHKDNIKKQFYIVYFYGYVGFANILFGMLNDPGVLFKVKGLILNVLKGSAQNNNSKFAEAIQMMYSDYKSIAGGIDIDFVPMAFENDSFEFPVEDVKKHLSEDLYDEDKNGFIGIVRPTYNESSNLTRVFKDLLKFKWIRKDELDTFIYRFTGQRKPKTVVDKIHWDGRVEDLLYLFKRFYGGCYDKGKQFFEIGISIKPQQYSAYADRPSSELKDLFKELYGLKNC